MAWALEGDILLSRYLQEKQGSGVGQQHPIPWHRLEREFSIDTIKNLYGISEESSGWT